MAGGDWRDVFCGRDVELRRLAGAYDAVARGEGPRLVVVCAERGMGKTRLVQELYRHLSTHHDPHDYWPDASLFKGNNLRVAPDFSDPGTQAHYAAFTTAERPMPFLWWGLRLADTKDRNAVPLDLQTHRQTLDPHLAWVRFARSRAEAQAQARAARGAGVKEVLVKGVELAADLAGVGAARTAWDLARSVWDLGRAGVDVRQSAQALQQEEARFECADLHGLETRRRDDLLEQTLDDLEELAQAAPDGTRTPLVVFCDDAQFACEGGDEGMLRLLERLWERAEQDQWPLMLVATHWAVDWEQDRRAARPSLAASFREVADDPARAELIVLGKQPDLGALVLHGLPGLPPRDVALLLRKADGNPQVLIELVLLLLDTPDYFEGGALSDFGREEVEAHTCELTALIRQRLSKAPHPVQRAVALSSLQGMSFLPLLSMAAAERLNKAFPADALAQAQEPLRLIIGDGGDTADFVQRAYRDAAYSLVRPRFAAQERQVADAVAQAAVELVDDGAHGPPLSAPTRRALLTILAALGEASDDEALRLRAGQALLQLVHDAPDNAQRAAHARHFEAGLDTRWPAGAFDPGQFEPVRQALADWHGPGRAAALCDRILAHALVLHAADPSDQNEARVDRARAQAAEAHEARGACDLACRLQQQRVDAARARAARSGSPQDLDRLCDALVAQRDVASVAASPDVPASELQREVVSIRRRQLEADVSAERRASLVDALEDLWMVLPPAEQPPVLQEVALQRRVIADASGHEADRIAEADAWLYLSDQLHKLGRRDEAAAAGQECLAILRGLWHTLRGDAPAKALSFALEALAEAASQAGQQATRRRLLVEALQVQQQRPTDVAGRRVDLQVLREALAHDAADAGDWALARHHCLQAEALARQAGWLDDIDNLRRELRSRLPDGVVWLELDDLQAEQENRRAERQGRLDELRARFADEPSRTAEVCNDLALALQQAATAQTDAARWDEAGRLAQECHRVEHWAREAGLHRGAWTDAETLEWLAWGLEGAGELAAARPVAAQVVALRRAEAATTGDAQGLGLALSGAANLAAQAGDWPDALRLGAEWLQVEREGVDADRDSNQLDLLLDPLGKVATYAHRAGDLALHDALHRERLAVARSAWESYGDGTPWLESALALLERALGRGDRDEALALAASMADMARQGLALQGSDAAQSGVLRQVGAVQAAAGGLAGAEGDAVRDALSAVAATLAGRGRRQSHTPQATAVAGVAA